MHSLVPRMLYVRLKTFYGGFSIILDFLKLLNFVLIYNSTCTKEDNKHSFVHSFNAVSYNVLIKMRIRINKLIYRN